MRDVGRDPMDEAARIGVADDHGVGAHLIGPVDQLSGGDTSSPSQVYLLGMAPPSAKASLERLTVSLFTGVAQAARAMPASRSVQRGARIGL